METTATLPARKLRLHLTALATFLFISLTSSIVGGAITRHSLRTWYPTLTRPSFTPPNWVFVPVWTMLYLVTAFAAWLVWRQTRLSRGNVMANLGRLEARKDAMALYGIQLILSLTWIFAFFYLHRLLVAVGVILLLWMAILSTIVLFWRIRQLTGLLLLPYLAWVSFVTALNLVFLRFN